jgi:hypothetical protein
MLVEEEERPKERIRSEVEQSSACEGRVEHAMVVRKVAKIFGKGAFDPLDVADLAVDEDRLLGGLDDGLEASPGRLIVWLYKISVDLSTLGWLLDLRSGRER